MTEVMEQPGFDPTFRLDETILTDIGELKVGQRAKIILNYKVVDQTKNFTLLKIGSVFPIQSKRIV